MINDQYRDIFNLIVALAAFAAGAMVWTYYSEKDLDND